MEIWRDIKDYEGFYQVSNLGNVKSIARKKKSRYSNQEINLKPSLNTQGYLFVGLYKNGKTTMKRINRLVAETFIPNPENKSQVNHKNEIKTDNRLENLEWLTAKENKNYSSRMIEQYSKNGLFIKTWENLNTIKYTLNIDKGNIIKCCQGKRKSAGGYKWKYNKSKGEIYYENNN